MTLIIALRCTDGLVMAADSMSTEAAPLNAGQIAKHETEKLVLYKELMWGASGSVGVKQAVQNELEKHYGDIYTRNISPTDLRMRLVKKIQPILKEQYTLISQLTQQLVPFTNFIFGVHLNSGFHLINIEGNCAGEVVEAKHCATGSGQKTGQALLRRLRNQDWNVKTGLVVAYRTLNDAIHVEPGGIGPPIRLARYFMSGQKEKLEMIDNEAPEFREIQDTVRLWTEIEQEGLDKLKAGPTAGGQTQAPQDLPKP
jgi:20S proteasome alpha/beta subunit